ncbi:phage tail tape measure protein [Flexivirga alba]|uniref:Phage tail tape measure protein n=1 Tax=Flexivirga alba TaxID=702742 RepID=A0ABW2AMG4_9MICO
MADRSLRVRLIADVGGYVAGMRTASTSTQQLGTVAQQTGVRARSMTGAMEQSTTRARGMTGAMGGLSGLLGGALLVGVGGAVKSFADFEEKMSHVRANVSGSNADFQRLTEAVKTQGTQFGFTATQSADATDDLAKAGLSASQIIGGGLTGALTLAAAGGVSTAAAAETAATAMTMFGLNSSQIPHIADLLAAGADRSTASVSSLSEGLQEGGSLAHLMGVSIEDTTAVLAEFDQSGLKGAKAGNALKTMFQNLLDPTKKQQMTMDDLGLSFFDANGQFIGLSATAGQLQAKLGGLTDKQRNATLSILFGARSIQAANILYKDGAKGVTDWQQKVLDAGFAARNAAAKTDNLNGDIHKLIATLQTDFINAGTGANGALRGIVQTLDFTATGIGLVLGPVSRLAGAFSKLPGPIQEAAFAFGAIKLAQRLFGDQLAAGRARMSGYVGGLRSWSTQVRTMGQLAREATPQMGRFNATVAAVGLGNGNIARMARTFETTAASASRLPRTMGAVRASMVGLRGAAGGLVGALGGPWGLAITGGVMALSAWISHTQKAKAASQQYKDEVANLTSTLNVNTGAITGNTRAEAFKGLQNSGAVDLAKKYGLNLRDLTDAALGSGSAQTRFNKSLAEMKFVDGTGQLSDDYVKLTKALGDQTGKVKDSKQAWKDAKAAGVEAGQAAEDAGNKGQAAGEKTQTAAEKAAQALDDLVKSYQEVGSAAQAQADSQLGFNKAILDANKAIKENGRNTNLMSEKGMANKQALLGLAGATTKYATDLAKNTGDQKAANAVLAQGRRELVQHAEDMGYSAQQAKNMADQWLPLSKGLHTDVSVNGLDTAIYKLDSMGNVVVSLQGKKVTIPADTPNAEHVAAVLYSVDKAALSANGKSVKIPTAAINSPETLRNLKGIKGARENADGSVSIPTAALNAAENTRLLGLLGRAAVDADGKTVIIPASTPNAPAVIGLIKQIHGAQITTNGKKVTITSSAPMAAGTRALIDKIRGAQVTANGKSVVINSSLPTYGATLAKIRGILAAAQSKTLTITTVFKEIHPGDNLARHGRNLGAAANGAIVKPGGHRYMANGGFGGRSAMIADKPILWAEAGPEAYLPLGANKHNARTEQILRVSADILGFDVIKRAVGGIDGVPAGWANARPAGSTQTVVVQGGSGGLTNEDRALMRQLPKLVEAGARAGTHAGAKAGIEGKSRADAQSAHLLRSRGGSR